MEHHISIAFVIEKEKKKASKNLVNLNSETHYIHPLYWGNGGFALVSFLVLYFELNNNAFVIVKNFSNQMAWITLFHLNIRMERTRARATGKSAMLYFEIMKTTGNNNDNRHAKYLVGGTIKYWREGRTSH